MLFFGSSEEARNYSCKIAIKTKFGNEISYYGPVHAIDIKEKAILNSGHLSLIGSNTKILTTEIEVTIQNLKSEAISTESQDFYQTNSDLSLDSDSSLDSDGHQN